MLNGRPQFRQKNRNRSYSESQSGYQVGNVIVDDERNKKSGNNSHKPR